MYRYDVPRSRRLPRSAATGGGSFRIPIRTPTRTPIQIQIRIPIRTRTRASRSTDVVRTAIGSLLALLTLTSPVNEYRGARAQGRNVHELVSELGASDPTARARAACEIRELGDTAVDAIQPLVAMLG